MTKSKEQNPFAGFNVLDYSNNLKVDQEDDSVNLDEMEEAIISNNDPIIEDKEEVEQIPEDTTITEGDTKEPKAKDNVTEEDSIIPFVKFLSEKGVVDYSEDDQIEDSEDGIASVIQKTIENNIKKKNESRSEVLKKAIEWEENGGNVEEFLNMYYTDVTYEGIQVSEDDTDLQKAILQDYLKMQDESDEDIQSIIEEYETGGILENESKRALKKLQKVEKETKEKKLEEQKLKKIENDKKLKEEWDNLKKSIDDREEIKGFKLTPKVKEKLWDHISKPVKDGKSQLKINNETNPDSQLLYAYLDLLGWDISKLEKKLETKVTSNLRKTLGKFTDTRNKMSGTGGTEIGDDNPLEGFKSIKL